MLRKTLDRKTENAERANCAGFAFNAPRHLAPSLDESVYLIAYTSFEVEHLVARATTEGERIAIEIEQVLAGDAWHGPSLDKLLEGVTANDAAQRPIPSAHNVWELVLHITSWANITRRRLTGGKVEPKKGENWPRPGTVSEKNWKSARAKLVESHERLREVVAGLSDEQLAAKVPKGRRSVSNMLHGLTQHDAYHGGQIALLKKALRSNDRNQS